MFLDDLMADHFERYGLAGASVTVVKDGEVFVSKGYGHADVAADAPVKADATLFPTASVAKLFTATAVMQLVEQGKLDLDANVNSYLSAFQIPDTFPEPVRVWHLLSHTAGFEDRPVVIAYSLTSDDLPDLETALIRFMPARDWEPGLYTAYSNYSTALAAHLVAEVSGMSWEEYLEAEIFQPLGMTHTSARQPVPEALAPGLTKVYGGEDGLEESEWEFSVLGPAGGIVSTGEDMGRFMLAHLQRGRLGDQRILQEATARQMHSQLFTHDARLPGNAHGFWESEEQGQRILSHAGDLNTAHTLLALAPEQGLGVYIAYNSTGGVEAREEFWRAFWDYALPADAPAVPGPAVESYASIEQFTGSYGINRISTTTMAKLFKLVSVLTVTAEDEVLISEVPGVEKQRWTQVGQSEFAEADGPGRMIFGHGADGRISHVAFNGSSLEAYSPLIAFVPTAWYDSPALHGGMLATSLLLVLSALLLWPTLAFARRRRGEEGSDGRVARWWAAATGGLYLLFVVLFAFSLLDFRALEYGLPPLLTVTLSTGVVAAVLTPGAVVHAVLAWRNGHWRLAGRIHYSFLALAYVVLVWQLNHWNLLGVQV